MLSNYLYDIIILIFNWNGSLLGGIFLHICLPTLLVYLVSIWYMPCLLTCTVLFLYSDVNVLLQVFTSISMPGSQCNKWLLAAKYLIICHDVYLKLKNELSLNYKVSAVVPFLKHRCTVFMFCFHVWIYTLIII